MKTQLCGREMVLFRDEDGAVHAIDNACPHRWRRCRGGRQREGDVRGPAHSGLPFSCAHATLRSSWRRGAPLSEGWVEKKGGKSCVACKYHGWALDQDGKIQDVPVSAVRRVPAWAGTRQLASCSLQSAAHPCTAHTRGATAGCHQQGRVAQAPSARLLGRCGQPPPAASPAAPGCLGAASFGACVMGVHAPWPQSRRRAALCGSSSAPRTCPLTPAPPSPTPPSWVSNPRMVQSCQHTCPFSRLSQAGQRRRSLTLSRALCLLPFLDRRPGVARCVRGD